MKAWLVCAVAACILAGCGARDEELPPAPAPRAEEAPAPEPAEDVVEPALPVKLVRARVYEADERAAIGARVTIESWRDVNGFWQGTADRAGLAQIVVADSVTALRVSASLPGYAIVSLQTNVALGPGTIECALRLRDAGVTVTAELQGPHAAAITQCFARIVPGGPLGWRHVGAAVTSNCSNGRIVFPAIVAGLDNLRVSFDAAGFARAESAVFNTRAGDVTVQVALAEGVALRGRAVFADGTPVPSFHLRAEPRVQGEVRANLGRIAQAITPDAGGYFGPLYLLQDFYRLTLQCDDAQTLVTNLYLALDDNSAEFVFSPHRTMTVRGTVLYHEPRGPAEGVTVTWETTPALTTNVMTDRAGEFAVTVRMQGEAPHGTLRIAHPGYAPIECGGYQFRSERPQTFFLYATAVIAGSTRCADGTPVSNVSVYANRSFGGFALRSTRRYTDTFEGQDGPLHLATARTSSDEFGRYALSNVAAPGAYNIAAHHLRYAPADPRRIPSVTVKPGEVHTHDVVLAPKPALYVRVLDPHGAPVRKFQLGIAFRTSRQSSSTSSAVQLSSDEWHEVTFDNQGERSATLELRATCDEQMRSSTNIAWHADMPPPYIVLPLAGLAGATGECVRGYIYDHERAPVDDANVSANLAVTPMGGSYGHGSARTDPLGYFEMPSLVLVSASVVRFYVNVGGQFVITNLLCTGAPVEWVLPQQTYVRGRVCIESSATPATSFWVGIVGQREPTLTHAPDGRFVLPVSQYARTREALILARVDGLAPAELPCDLAREGDTDVGDIIIRGKPARVSGRVVDERGEPIGAYVTLGAAGVMIKSMNVVQTKDGDGTYAFSELPPESYRVVVMSVEGSSFSEAASSGMFELQPGEDKTLPDLVVMTTNTPLVSFTFLLPDGTPAARATTPFPPNVTDENGMLVTRVKCAAYAGISVQIGNDRYSADDFTVTPQTRELTVRLRALTELGGTVTLDGAPMGDGYLMCTAERGGGASASVRNGRFTLAAQPGRYFVSSGDGAATVSLHAGEDNVIALTRGSATLRVNTPEGETWYNQLTLRFGEGSASLPGQQLRNVYTGLHPGEYTVRAIRVAGASIMTNIELRVTLGAGVERTITVGGP